MVGPYTIDDLPSEILNKISKGLTKTEKDGSVKPDIAEKWKVSPNGKAYAFILNKNLHFSDGSNVTSDNINYGFSDVSVVRPDKHTIVFNLKDNYSPFLATVTRPIFKKGFVGVGEYKVKKVKLNGNFVESIELYSERLHKALTYQLFYPTFASLKIAFSLGEVSKITNLPTINFKNTTLSFYKNAKVEKKVNHNKLVTLFFNTKDSALSSKTLREGLWYTMPDNFSQGERNPSPLSHFSYANQEGLNVYRQDLEHAKILIDKTDIATISGKIALTIDALHKYEETAKTIAGIWKKLNIDAKIRIVNKIPESFQVFLGEFNLSSDPDQYALWHSSAVNNITHYDNKRIDKLLEDGRKELDIEKRKIIYSDFQKYIFADPPAAFLFFPYYYEVSKK
jgi:peptide/nickel transport system substrate-binding protein